MLTSRLKGLLSLHIRTGTLPHTRSATISPRRKLSSGIFHQIQCLVSIRVTDTDSRGTLRYTGFPEFVKVLVDIGFLNDEEQSYFKESIAWKEATQKVLGAPSSDENDLLATISAKTAFKDNEQRDHILGGLKWLGIFSSEKVSIHIFRFLLARDNSCSGRCDFL